MGTTRLAKMAATRVLPLLVLFIALSGSSEVELLDDKDPIVRLCEGADEGCEAGDALNKAIASGGKGTTIADAKKAIKQASAGADPQQEAQVQAVAKAEKADEAKAAIAQKAEVKATEQQKALREEAKKVEEEAKEEEKGAAAKAQAAKEEVDQAKMEAAVNRERAEVTKKADQRELDKAKAEADKAVDGAIDKSLTAAQTSYNVADKAASAAEQNVAKARDELQQAAAATSTVDTAVKQAAKDETKAKDAGIIAPEVKITAAMWADKVAQLKKEAFDAHIDSAHAAQAELDAQKAIHRYEADLMAKREEAHEEKAAVSEKAELVEESTRLANEADANAKFSVARGPVRKQLLKNAKKEDEQEQTAQVELAASRKKAEATEGAFAAMEHGNALPRLKAVHAEAERKMNEADIIARNTENDYVAANGHYKEASNEQKRKDERAKVAAEIRHKKAASGHKLAELQLFKAKHLRKEAKEKLHVARKAKDHRDKSIAAEQKLAEKTKKAEAKAEQAREDNKQAAMKESKEAAEKSKENGEKEAKKAENEATIDKHKAAEVGQKAQAMSGAGQAAAHSAPVSACQQCKGRCKSESCKTWCDKHWCASLAEESNAHLANAAKSLSNAQISVAAQKESRDEKKEEKDIEKAIQNGGATRDIEKAKADSEATAADANRGAASQ